MIGARLLKFLLPIIFLLSTTVRSAAALELEPPFDLPLLPIDQPRESITILGEARATQAQMIRFINHRNPAPKLTCSVEDIVRYYYEEGAREGIRGDIALCQALKETGFFAYGGDVDPAQNNYCGLGATGNGVKGAAFDNARLGARAHIQHLLAYATTRRPSVDVIDPRYEIVQEVRRYKINNWIGLGGTWAVPGKYYGQDILNNWKQALAIDRIELSVEACSQAVDEKPCYENYYNRALAYERLNDFDRAIADYTSTIEIEPTFPQAWYNRGCARLSLGQYDEALADFNRVLELEPRFKEAKNNIAVIQSLQNETPSKMIDRPIGWTARREQLTKQYSMTHYGFARLTIEPQAVVVHWTALGNAEGVIRFFDSDANDDGEVQVASHFLVDRDGTIYRLTPETRLNRHAIGYNWCAIGIENVGGVNGREDLTEAQLRANVELIRYLHKKFPSIEYVFGHYQQKEARASGLFIELVEGYYAEKPDPGEKFMRALKAQLLGDGLKFF